MTTFRIVLIVTATTTGLVAGLMYGYMCSVNPGLARVADKEYISSMQAINRAILNPVFFLSFMGSLVLLPMTAWMSFGKSTAVNTALITSAAVVYVIGVFGVTMMGNVPLNEALDKFDLQSASAAELAKRRLEFSVPWNRLHAIRTLASVGAFVLLLCSCIKNSR